MSLLEAADKSTVIAVDEIDSEPDELVTLKSIVGWSSSSIIVKVWTLSAPNVALLGLDKVTITVSFVSSVVSSIIFAIVIVPVVSPAAILNVPFTRV